VSSNTPRPHKVKDLTGQRFGRLLVIERLAPETIFQPLGDKRALWQCQCDCGKQCVVRGSDLCCKSRPGIRSCGCLRGRPKKGETLRDAYQRRGLTLPEGAR